LVSFFTYVNDARSHEPKAYVYIVDSCTKYFVGLQQCIGDPLLNFCDNTGHLYLWQLRAVDNNAHGTYCCVFM